MLIINPQQFYLTHVAENGGWDEIDTDKCKGFGDFGKKLYTNCNIQGTLAYIERCQNPDPNVLMLPFDSEILSVPIGISTWGNHLSVYNFGLYPNQLSDENKILFCRTVWDNRRGGVDNPVINADIMIGPRADHYIDQDMDLIENDYYVDSKLINDFNTLMKKVYEPQIVFSQAACNSLFYDIDESNWIRGSQYVGTFAV